MRALFLALALLATVTTAANAQDYAIIRARFLSVAFVAHPDDGEVRIGADLEGTLRVTAVLYGSFEPKRFHLDMNARDGLQLKNVFLVISHDDRGDPIVEAYSPAEFGFCIDAERATHVPAEEIMRLRNRYPCTNTDW